MALTAGIAQCTTQALTAVNGATTRYHLNASYSGDANHDGSTATTAITVTVLSAADAVFRDGFEPATQDCPL